MQELSYDAAKALIDAELKKLQPPTPALMYLTGDAFSGTIFANFETLRDANEVVTKASQSGLAAPVWCKKDLLSVLLPTFSVAWPTATTNQLGHQPTCYSRKR